MANTRLWFLVSGVLVILLSGIFTYYAEILKSPILILYYLAVFLVIFFPPMELNRGFLIKHVTVSWVLLLIIGLSITFFASKGHGSGLLGDYSTIYFLLYIFTPMILILILGFILRAIFFALRT